MTTFDDALTPNQNITTEEIAQLGEKWGWMLATGIFGLMLGIISMLIPIATTVALAYGVGLILVASGIVHAIHSFELRHQRGTGARFFHSAISLIAGILMLRYIGAGMMGITLTLGFYFFISAAAKLSLALGMRPHEGWVWVAISSLLSFALGIYILWTMPVSALWVPGLLLSIELIVGGSSLIALAFSIHNAAIKRPT